MSGFSKNSHIRKSKVIVNFQYLSLSLVILVFIYFQLFRNSITETQQTPIASNGGDCGATGPRRPSWDDRSAFLQAIPEFRTLYEKRPFKPNEGGMRFDHSFTVWYILRIISPSPQVVVESGAHRGHSTWLIRQALPNVRIVSISPHRPHIYFPNVLYLNGENFTDFSEIQWDKISVNPKHAVVLLDDHQSAFRRIFREGMAKGFYRYIQDDNYGYFKGSNLNMKWLCEVERKSEFRGFYSDNFGKVRKKQTWEEHMMQARELNSKIKIYYEFPPVLSRSISNASFHEEKRSSPPLIKDYKLFERMIGLENLEECRYYVHMCYVETH